MKIEKLHVDVTGKCNLSCKYCFVGDQDCVKQILKTPDILRLIGEAIDLGIRRFSISGGEPFCNPDLIEILKACSVEGSNVTLFTNLENVEEETMSEIVFGTNTKRFIVSLDGFAGHDNARPPSRHGNVIKNLKLLRGLSSGCRISVNTVVHKHNLKELTLLLRELLTIGVSDWRVDLPLCTREAIFCDFQEVVSTAADIIQLRYAEDSLKKITICLFRIYKSELEEVQFGDVEHLVNPDAHVCEYALGEVAIKQDGSLTMCPPLNLQMGLINHDVGLGETLQQFSNDPFFSLRIGSIKDCLDCRYIKLCATGCRADALNWTGSCLQPDPVSCTIMPLVERNIIPVLSTNLAGLYKNMINPHGRDPKYVLVNHEGNLSLTERR